MAEARDKPAKSAPREHQPTCPECGSTRIWRAGFRRLADGSKAQMYQCAECLRRFTDPLNRKSSRRIQNDRPLSLNTGLWLASLDEEASGAGFASEMGARWGGFMEKPLLTGKRPAGGAATDEQLQSLLMSFGLWLLKQGRAESTARKYVKAVRSLARKGVDLMNPESVKEYLAKACLANASKNLYINAYDGFLRFVGVSWDKPRYRVQGKIPFIPTEEELDVLIAGCGRKMATLLQLLKETGARIGEALKLRWIDIDFKRRVVRITPEKGGKPRILPISVKLVEMLKNMPKKGENVFPTSLYAVSSNFYNQRRRLAKRLNNPRLLKIGFHTFRHWKATMEYHRTKDIIHVQQLLGHKNIQSTMVYISIEKALFQSHSDEFHCRATRDDEEAIRLIEAGFEYVTTTPSGLMLFRKRK